MDSKSTSQTAPGPLTAMLHNATIDKAEGNEFSNSARDMFKIVLNYHQGSRSPVPSGAAQTVENPLSEFHDAIHHLLNTVPIFMEEVRKNDQSRSTVGETTAKDSSDPVSQTTTTDHTPHPPILENPVDVIDIVPPEPTLLPVANIADRYARSMLKCLLGYPLYNPKPFSELSTEYPRNGINIGDVGFVRGTGTFDFLFNICPPQNASINPPNVPDGFSFETPEHSATTILEPLPSNTRLFQNPITKTRSGEYICEGSEGAVLELPKGAVQCEATNTRPFEKFAARHGVQWYEYTMARGRSISNGSLYLITSVTKCDQWGIAVFDRPCAPGQGLRFDKKRSLLFGKSSSEYRWKGSDTFSTKVSNPDKGDAANQCVFVRGYKIMIRQDIFDYLSNDQPRRPDSVIPSSSPQAGSTSMTRERATRIRGGAGPDPGSRITDAGLLSPTTTTTSDPEVVLHSNFTSSLLHPSDLINAALLSQNPGAKVALTHDDVWCNLLRDNFPRLDYATLINVARSYTNTIEHDCVSLEKISQPRYVLGERSYALQETGSLAFQEPLTPPDNDSTPVPAMTSLTLPHELVERILLLLDIEFTLKCRLVNREFNTIIHSSALVQYYLACRVAGVIDNPRSPLSCAERLDALKKREDAWRKLKPLFETTIRVIDQPSTFYELSAGNYFLCDKNGKDLYYSHLPSSPEDNPQWIGIPGHGPEENSSEFILEMGMAIYEHDLVVKVISSEIGNHVDIQHHSLDLVLLQFSTGEYHPLARHSLIHVLRSPSARPHASVKIVGDNLALVVHYQDGSTLFIFDWKTGHKRLQHKASEDAYNNSAPVFVSPELLLVPNRVLSRFEIWNLFPSHPSAKAPVQILSLKIPAVSVDYSIIRIDCHGEPSPFLHSTPYVPQRPFFHSPENSIITINLVLRYLPGLRQNAYKIILNRCALLDLIQKWTSSSLLEQQGLTWLTNEVTAYEIVDPDDGSVRLGAQSELVPAMPQPGPSPRSRDFPALPTSQISTTSPTSRIFPGSGPSSGISESSSSTSRYNILKVPWADWGPPVSRWFRTYRWWIHESAGQRCVFLDRNPREKRKFMVGVADFNLHNVRRSAEMIAQLSGEGEDNGRNNSNGEGKKEDNEEGLELLDHESVFLEDLYMGLKCVVYYLPGEYDFDAVLMDEERLLGLKHNGSDLESITVLYFG